MQKQRFEDISDHELSLVAHYAELGMTEPTETELFAIKAEEQQEEERLNEMRRHYAEGKHLDKKAQRKVEREIAELYPDSNIDFRHTEGRD